MPVPLEQPRVKTRLNKYAAPGFPPSSLLYFFFLLSLYQQSPKVKGESESGAGGREISVARNWPMARGLEGNMARNMTQEGWYTF